MPKVSVYLPDELYAAARERGLSISTLTQRALREALLIDQTNQWIEGVRSRRPRVTAVLDTHAALDAAREELGA